MYSRHPASAHWNSAHKFMLCTLKIQQIVVLDWYGGPHFVDPTTYYNVKDIGQATNDEIEVSYSNSQEELNILLKKETKIKIIKINQY